MIYNILKLVAVLFCAVIIWNLPEIIAAIRMTKLYNDTLPKKNAVAEEEKDAFAEDE